MGIQSFYFFRLLTVRIKRIQNDRFVSHRIFLRQFNSVPLTEQLFEEINQMLRFQPIL